MQSRSYYEIVLGVITVFVAVAFLQESNVVKAITSSVLFLVYLSKEIILFFEEKLKKETKETMDAIKEAEIRKEVDQIKADLTKIHLNKVMSR
jgi:hypothetical protein